MSKPELLTLANPLRRPAPTKAAAISNFNIDSGAGVYINSKGVGLKKPSFSKPAAQPLLSPWIKSSVHFSEIVSRQIHYSQSFVASVPLRHRDSRTNASAARTWPRCYATDYLSNHIHETQGPNQVQPPGFASRHDDYHRLLYLATGRRTRTIWKLCLMKLISDSPIKSLSQQIRLGKHR
ncbi:hypothetical protein ACJ72_01637 [Emergomyces africanus]|uniref:Uncharacterized protein n=1 Tax=Emergomyces africanus TaxID=1955775 RepID=A0A1B7P4N6_9EURO|nr:hypothetical protein ACJ72_01637 [Emergomyces africanus]